MTIEELKKELETLIDAALTEPSTSKTDTAYTNGYIAGLSHSLCALRRIAGGKSVDVLVRHNGDEAPTKDGEYLALFEFSGEQKHEIATYRGGQWLRYHGSLIKYWWAKPGGKS